MPLLDDKRQVDTQRHDIGQIDDKPQRGEAVIPQIGAAEGVGNHPGVWPLSDGICQG